MEPAQRRPAAEATEAGIARAIIIKTRVDRPPRVRPSAPPQSDPARLTALTNARRRRA